MPTLDYYLRRFRELGLREGTHQGRLLFKKRISETCGRLYDQCFASDLSEADLIRHCGFSSGEELVNHFKHRKTPVFFLREDLDHRIPDFKSKFPDQVEKIISNAESILNHEFDLLGSGPTALQSESLEPGYLPWHADFKSGAAWNPRMYFKNIRYGRTPAVDVKVPWELSRFHHLITLGQAYRLTGDERYVTEYVCEVTDWIEKNPCRYGVNWSCTMEVAIRAVNWIWAFYFFKSSSTITVEFWLKFIRSLYLHAQFIHRNLEYREVWIDGSRRRLNSNHYLSDIIGLLYVAVLFPEFRFHGQARFAASELEIELFEQTLQDGTDYEHSTAYHRLVLEIFISGFLLLQLNGTSMSRKVAARLERMAEFVADYLRPDGTAPQIGDSDNGRLHPLSVRDYSDHRYLPSAAAETFQRDDLRLCDADPELWWWLGTCSRRTESTARASRGYPETGFYIMRCRDVHVFVSAATVGMHGFGSHSHNDLLSFEYWYKNQSWIVDPGTYVYTPDPQARNWFRSTEAHNTVRVDGVDINPVEPDQLFQMSDRAKVQIHDWVPGPDHDLLDAEHTGYARLNGAIRHRRRWALFKGSGELLVQDSFAGTGEHVFEWFFHAAPSVIIEREGHDVVLRHATNRLLLRANGGLESAEITEGWYSPSYGVRRRAPVIICRKRANAPTSGEIRLIPLPT